MIRGGDGIARAFANSCRHRGTQLLTGEGNCKAIVCPYHGWAFDLSGALVSVAEMDETVGFDKDDHALIPLRLECWAGFLFVNFDEEADSLSDYLGTLADHIGSYNFPDMVTTRRKVWDVACNWKVYLENQRESYHVPFVHRESLGDQIATPLDNEGAWSGSLIPVEQTAGIMKGETTPFLPIKSLAGEALRGSHFLGLYPTTYFVATTDCFWWMEIKPRGPERIELIVGSGFPRETAARDDFETVVNRYYTRWDTSHKEDNEICERQQAGLTSPLALPGRLARRERGVNAVDRWIVERMLAA